MFSHQAELRKLSLQKYRTKLTFISLKINSSLLSSQSISDGSRMRIEGLATFICLVIKIFLPSDPKNDFLSQFGRAVSVKALTRSSPLLAGHAGNCRRFFSRSCACSGSQKFDLCSGPEKSQFLRFYATKCRR